MGQKFGDGLTVRRALGLAGGGKRREERFFVYRAQLRIQLRQHRIEHGDGHGISLFRRPGFLHRRQRAHELGELFFAGGVRRGRRA